MILKTPKADNKTKLGTITSSNTLNILAQIYKKFSLKTMQDL
jgi:hypothetical protein